MSLSQPLGLHKHLTQPSRGLDIVPLFDVLLIALMLTLLGSRFIFAPGISVELPRGGVVGSAPMEPGASMAVLTLLKDNSLIYGGRLLSVENFEREAQNRQLAIAAQTGGSLYGVGVQSAVGALSGAAQTGGSAQATDAGAQDGVKLANATDAANTAGLANSAGDPAPAAARVLLIKSDVSVNTGTLLRVMNAARAAGYDRVQIAEQTGRSEDAAGASLRR